MTTLKNRQIKRLARHKRVRAKIIGTAERPRFSIFKSNKHIYVQLIDDNSGKTLSSVSDKEMKGAKSGKAYELGKFIAKKAVGLGIKKIVFDRGGYKFHGSISKAALGAREGGLEF